MTKRTVLALLGACLLCAAGMTGCGGGNSGGSKTGKKGESSAEASSNEDLIDAEEYFSENGKVLHKTDAAKSKKVKTEHGAAAMLSQRGFGETELTAEYSMDGSYLESTPIDADGKEKHPMYSSVYTTAGGNTWGIYIINGSLYADPYFYNNTEEHMLEAPVLLSETKTIISYDGNTNQFFETVPDEAVMNVKVVKKINAELLESLTEEEIDKL